MPNENTNHPEALAWLDQNAELVAAIAVFRLGTRIFPTAPAVLKACLAPCLDVVLQQPRITVEVIETPWDISTQPCQTDEDWPLDEYETVADFLQEPDGSSRATYVPGSGLAAGTFEDVMREELLDHFGTALKAIVLNDGEYILQMLGAPPGVFTLTPKELLDGVEEEIFEQLAEQDIDLDVEDSISRMSFRDVVSAIRPEILDRINALEAPVPR